MTVLGIDEPSVVIMGVRMHKYFVLKIFDFYKFLVKWSILVSDNPLVLGFFIKRDFYTLIN